MLLVPGFTPLGFEGPGVKFGVWLLNPVGAADGPGRPEPGVKPGDRDIAGFGEPSPPLGGRLEPLGAPGWDVLGGCQLLFGVGGGLRGALLLQPHRAVAPRRDARPSHCLIPMTLPQIVVFPALAPARFVGFRSAPACRPPSPD